MPVLITFGHLGLKQSTPPKLHTPTSCSGLASVSCRELSLHIQDCSASIPSVEAFTNKISERVYTSPLACFGYICLFHSSDCSKWALCPIVCPLNHCDAVRNWGHL